MLGRCVVLRVQWHGAHDRGMARKVSTVITDGIDGSPGAATVRFGLDGTSYEIDLTAANRARLDRTLAPFIAAARPASLRRRPAIRTAAVRADRAAVRAWAKEAGLTVSGRGRLSAAVMRQSDAAH
jgi:hypothetical protein